MSRQPPRLTRDFREQKSFAVKISKAFLVWFCLEAQRVVDEDHVNPSRMAGEARDQILAANRVGRLAVHAAAGLGAGRGQPKALGVNGRGDVARTFQGAVHVGTYLVHADDQGRYQRLA